MKSQRWLIVSHDAGGAEVISAWVRRHTEISYDFLLEGPAVKIFERKLVEIGSLTRENLELLDNYDLVLTGTSWASDLEKIVILRALESGKRVASYIDHWVNYEERFLLNGRKMLPDEIWLGDEKALEIAKRFFPEDKLKLVPNVYFEDIKKEFREMATPSKDSDNVLHILYVTDPVEDLAVKQFGDAHYFGYTEFEALDGFLDHLRKFSFKESVKVRLRLHPSERKEKYDNILKNFLDMPIEKVEGSTLVEDCVWADWVVGCESMALVIGIFAKKKVYTAIPDYGLACRLPFDQIRKFNQQVPNLNM